MITFIEDISTLTNDELVDYSVKLVKHEDRTGLEIIACLREAEKRLLYCTLGKSLWDYATQVLKLSKGNAQQKIDTMRLMRENPIAKEKVQTGELSISNAAKVKSFLRQEERAGNIYTPEEKAGVIESVCGLSQSKCERALLALNPEAIPAEKVRPLTETKTELKIVVDQETMDLLERLKELLSNKMPNASYADLLDFLAREKIESLEKKQMGSTLKELENQPGTSCATSCEDAKVPSPLSGVTSVPLSGALSPTPRKYISVKDRRWTMKRALGQCEHIAPNGVRCSNRRNLHLDHIIPLALGGKNERSNYRAACRSCNLYYAKMHLGDVMNKYVPSLN